MLSKTDLILKYTCLLSLLTGIFFLFLMIIFIFKESSLGINFRPNLLKFLFFSNWSPSSVPPQYGIRHAIISTILISWISMIIAVPIGIGIGLFLSEIAPKYIQNIIQPALELLAGIPAVVFGFFGYVLLVKNFEIFFNMPSGECVLVAGIVLSMMILPFIATTSAETFRNVPNEYREASLSLGVTKSYMIIRILFRKAFPGIFAAIALGLARALGETLAVLMLAGNSTQIPMSLLDRAQPITALIATELGETSLYSEKYYSIYTSGLILMLVVIFINVGIWIIKRRFLSKEYV